MSNFNMASQIFCFTSLGMFSNLGFLLYRKDFNVLIWLFGTFVRCFIHYYQTIAIPVMIYSNVWL